MGHLSIFESKFSRLKEDRDNVMRAKEALELQEPGRIYFNVITFMSQNVYKICTLKKFMNFLKRVNHLILELFCERQRPEFSLLFIVLKQFNVEN